MTTALALIVLFFAIAVFGETIFKILGFLFAAAIAIGLVVAGFFFIVAPLIH